METQKQNNMREKDFPNRRRPWTAVFLSLLMPGLGQIYCGSFVNGLVLMLIVGMFSSLWMFGMLVDKVREMTPTLVFVIMLAFVLLATIVAAIDAYCRARRTRYDYIVKEYNRWFVYLILLWISGAGLIIYPFYIKEMILGNYHITANTMAPTIVDGDRAFVNRMAYKNKDPEYGDVVVFKNPENRKRNYIKRIVALGGDTVQVKNGQLLINGKELIRQQIEGNRFWEINNDVKYQILISENTSNTETQDESFGPVTVPQYHCFVMADNRNCIVDSRKFGALSYGALKGRFTQIYWPLQHQATLDARDN